MNINVQTKYDIGQKAYIADHGFTIEFFAREVEIKSIVTRYEYIGGEPKQYVMYIVSPTTGVHGNFVLEDLLHETEAEAEAEAELLNRAFGSEREDK